VLAAAEAEELAALAPAATDNMDISLISPLVAWKLEGKVA